MKHHSSHRGKRTQWRGATIALLLCGLLTLSTACNPWFTPITSDPSQTTDWTSTTPKLPDPIDDPDIDMQVDIGYGGAYQMQSWTKLRATIENRGDDFDGSLILPVIQDDGNSVVEYAAPVQIPSGATKQIALPFIPNMLRKDMTPRLERDGTIIERVNVGDLTPLPLEMKLIGTLSDDAPSLAYWKDRSATLTTFIPTNTVVLDAASVPDDASAFACFGAIVVDDFDLTTLETGQRAALRDWLNQGGILIAGSGLAGQKTLAGLAEIAPISMSGSADNTGAAIFLDATFGSGSKIQGDPNLAKLSPGSETLLKTPAGASLVERYNVGEGYVLATAFELGKRPFANWHENMAMWHSLLTQTGASESWNLYNTSGAYYYGGYYNPYERILSNIPAGHMPSIPLVYALLAVFCLAAGPLLYIVLKKRDQRDLAWLLIPVLAAVFAAGVFSFSLRQNRSEIAASTVSVLEPGAGGASASCYAGALLPDEGPVRLETDIQGLVRPQFTLSYDERAYASSMPMAYGATAAPEAGGPKERVIGRVTQGATPGVSFDNTANWSMGYLSLNTRFDGIGRVEGTLQSIDGKLQGKLVNRTGFDLDQIIVMGITDYQSFDDVAQGATIDVSLQNYQPLSQTASAKSAPMTGYSSYDLFYRMQAELYKELDEAPTTMDDSQTEWRRDLSSRRLALDAVCNAKINPNLQQSGNVKIQLLAFSKEAGVFPIHIDGRTPDRSYHMGIITHAVDLVYEANGTVNIPFGVIRSSLIKNESEPSASIDMDGVSFQGSEGATCLVEIPDFERYTIEELSLQCQPMYSPKLLIALWDAKSYPTTEAERAARVLVKAGNPSALTPTTSVTYALDGSDPHWVLYKPGTKLTGAEAARFIDDKGAIKVGLLRDPADATSSPDNYQRASLPTIALKGKVK